MPLRLVKDVWSCRRDAVFGGKKKKRKILRASDAFEQVRVAVGSSAAVAEFPDARPELHGTPVAHPTLTGGDGEVIHIHSDTLH